MSFTGLHVVISQKKNSSEYYLFGSIMGLCLFVGYDRQNAEAADCDSPPSFVGR
jgi:hypothetical protein